MVWWSPPHPKPSRRQKKRKEQKVSLRIDRVKRRITRTGRVGCDRPLCRLLLHVVQRMNQPKNRREVGKGKEAGPREPRVKTQPNNQELRRRGRKKGPEKGTIMTSWPKLALNRGSESKCKIGRYPATMAQLSRPLFAESPCPFHCDRRSCLTAKHAINLR